MFAYALFFIENPLRIFNLHRDHPVCRIYVYIIEVYNFIDFNHIILLYAILSGTHKYTLFYKKTILFYFVL